MTNERGESRPVRIAIVGGGCAGLAAAWHLSQQRGYEVHVYERSWRLGGKGASVRDENGRIRDHGLHVWLGFYENAFRMARECYTEVRARGWGPESRASTKLTHGCFEDAFFPEPHIGVAGRDASGRWVIWSGNLPPSPGIPGDPIVPASNPFTLANYLLRCIDLLKTLMLSVIGPPKDDDPALARPRRRRRSAADETPSPDVLIGRIARDARNATLTGAAALLQTVAIIEKLLQRDVRDRRVDRGLDVLRALVRQTRKQLTDVVAIDPELRWKTEIIDIVMTIAVGLYRDRLLFERRGLDAVNNEDYREWLKRHGATHSARNSRFLEGIYDFVFAYEGGNRKKRGLAAGVALRCALRMFFTYRGAMFWRMRSGMGDAVFAPLYRVMLLDHRQAKGETAPTRPPVAFHFLHELRGVTLATRGKGRHFVTELHFQTCGDPDTLDKGGAHALDELGCWPHTPRLFGQTRESPWTGTRTLRIADSFDAVVFALSIEDLKRLGSGAPPNQPGSFLTEMPPEWRTMADHVKTVATKAGQVWLRSDLESLGWTRGSVLVSALGQRFDTWADMTHTLGSERAWRRAQTGKPSPADEARSVAYFCAALPDGVPPQNVAEDLEIMLEDRMRFFWPAAFGDGDTSADLVIGEKHVQANTGGSDRYVLSLPESIDKRISPLDCPVLNMTIAGDWTACGLDVGCIEAAVMSGMLAAHAITGGKPALEEIVGYDHP